MVSRSPNNPDVVDFFILFSRLEKYPQRKTLGIRDENSSPCKVSRRHFRRCLKGSVGVVNTFPKVLIQEVIA